MKKLTELTDKELKKWKQWAEKEIKEYDYFTSDIENEQEKRKQNEK